MPLRLRPTLYLRDPPVLKKLQGGNFGTGSKFGKGLAKCYGEGSEMLVFFKPKRQENGTDSGKLRRQNPGAFLGDNRKETKPPFLAPSGPTF